jgi:hypothetical protein
VKRRVEACDRGDVRQCAADRIQRGERLGLVQRRELDELAERRLRLAVDQRRLAEALAAVHDPVPDGVGVCQTVL